MSEPQTPAPATPAVPAPAIAPSANPPTRAAVPRPGPATPAEQQQKNPAGEFSTTAVTERLPETNRDAASAAALAADPDVPKDRAGAERRVADLRKEYDGVLAQIRETADPQQRAQLVVRKGNLTRQMDAARRAHDLP